QLFQNKQQEAKIDFIKRLSLIDPHKVPGSNTALEDFKIFFTKIFPKNTEVLNILKKHVFDESFWSKDLTQQKCSILWVMSVYWIIYPNQKNITDIIYPIWIKILNQALNKDQTELAFFLYYPCQHIQLLINESTEGKIRVVKDIETPLSNYNYNLTKKYNLNQVKNKLTQQSKKRIAFVYPRLVLNSPTKVLLSLLKSLTSHGPNEYEYYIYDLEAIETTPSDPLVIESFKKLGVHYINNHQLLEEQNNGYYFSYLDKCLKIRESITQQHIDVLIGVGVNIQTNFLFSTRSAPMQVYWWHGSEYYNVKNIDIRIVHSRITAQNNIINAGNFDYNCFVSVSDKAMYNPPIDKSIVSKIRNQYPANTIILGMIGRIKKMDSNHYLNTIAAIMDLNPNTIFLACGAGNINGEGPYDNIVKSLKKLGIEDRVYFTGQINPHIYGHVIDFMLDTFPMRHGEAKQEFLAKKGLVLCLKGQVYPEDLDNSSDVPARLVETYKEKFNEKGLNRTFAYSINDYIQIADHLIKNILINKQKKEIFVETHNEEYKNMIKQMDCYQETAKGFIDIINSNL
ncbi:hypothetical protein BVY03_01435, partial [bacterium K02(2017)]